MLLSPFEHLRVLYGNRSRRGFPTILCTDGGANFQGRARKVTRSSSGPSAGRWRSEATIGSNRARAVSSASLGRACLPTCLPLPLLLRCRLRVSRPPRGGSLSHTRAMPHDELRHSPPLTDKKIPRRDTCYFLLDFFLSSPSPSVLLLYRLLCNSRCRLPTLCSACCGFNRLPERVSKMYVMLRQIAPISSATKVMVSVFL